MGAGYYPVRGGASRYTVLRRVGDVTHLDDIVSEI
jgi:hypothetical protein